MEEKIESCPYRDKDKIEEAIEKTSDSVQQTSTIAQTTSNALNSFIKTQKDQRKELLHALDRIHDRIYHMETKVEQRHREVEGELDKKIDITHKELLREINSNRNSFKEFRGYIIGACAVISVVISFTIAWGYNYIDRSNDVSYEQEQSIGSEENGNE